MGSDTKIEWADHTFNPWMGCTKVSAACKHCYAETLMDVRWGKAKWGPKGTRTRTSDANWRKPYVWNRAAEAEGWNHMVFCASLADVFEGPETMPPDVVEFVDDHRLDLWDLIKETPSLTWMLLTKRPENVRKMVPGSWTGEVDPCSGCEGARFEGEICDHCESCADGGGGFFPNWPDNVWIGVTVEDQTTADERVPHLLRIPAPVRFLSCEPLLGGVRLDKIPHEYGQGPVWIDGLRGAYRHADSDTWHEGRYAPLRRIDWVIAGGESGAQARPSHPDWFRSLRDQCAAAGVPYFFKQWGEWAPRSGPTLGVKSTAVDPDGGQKHPLYTIPGVDAEMARVGKEAAGNTLDGAQHLARP